MVWTMDLVKALKMVCRRASQLVCLTVLKLVLQTAGARDSEMVSMSVILAKCDMLDRSEMENPCGYFYRIIHSILCSSFVSLDQYQNMIQIKAMLLTMRETTKKIPRHP